MLSLDLPQAPIAAPLGAHVLRPARVHVHGKRIRESKGEL